MGRLNRATRLFHTLRRSFWMLPTLGCITAFVLAVGIAQAAGGGLPEWVALRGTGLPDEADAAQDLFAAIAGATATIMSLTYTLTLLIFTLAAGQLGPRLLDSFHDNRVNQMTITAMSATFVFAIVSMALTAEGQEPQLGALVALSMCILSVMLLIYFVHDVAQRVLVDNEIALTAQRLRTAIDASFRDRDSPAPPDPAFPGDDDGTRRIVTACKHGYLRSIDMAELVGDMQKKDAMIEILVAPGDFIVERMPVALVRRQGRVEDWQRAVNDRLICGNSRSSEGDILFSVKLMVEIALRALSPGVNDSFTAISAIDHLSGVFAELLNRISPSPVYMDDDGVARVMATTLSVTDIVDAAFHPIRLAAAGNMLVSCAMLDALRRMTGVCDARHLPHLRDHARMIAGAALPDHATEADRARLDLKLTTLSPTAA